MAAARIEARNRRPWPPVGVEGPWPLVGLHTAALRGRARAPGSSVPPNTFVEARGEETVGCVRRMGDQG